MTKRPPRFRVDRASRQVLVVLAPSQDEYVAAWESVSENLDDHMGRGPEPEQGDGLAVLDLREADRAVADHAGAEQGGGFQIRVGWMEGMGEVLSDNHVLCVSTRDIQARSAGPVTEVLATFSTERTLAAGRMQPRNPHAISLVMSGDG